MMPLIQISMTDNVKNPPSLLINAFNHLVITFQDENRTKKNTKITEITYLYLQIFLALWYTKTLHLKKIPIQIRYVVYHE